jgi:hypothetical protein
MRIYNATDEWNSEADFDAIKIDVTDTSSNYQSKLLLLEVSGVPKFSVRKDGLVDAKSMVIEQDLGFGYTVKIDGEVISPTDKPIILWEGTGVPITSVCADAVTESGCNNIPTCTWTAGYDCSALALNVCGDYAGCTVEPYYCEDYDDLSCPGAPCSLEGDMSLCSNFDGDEEGCNSYAGECTWGDGLCTGEYANGNNNCVGGQIGDFCDGGEYLDSCSGPDWTDYSDITLLLPQPDPLNNEYSSVHFIKNYSPTASSLFITSILNTNNGDLEDSFLLPFGEGSFFVHVGSGQWLALELI